MNNKKRLCVLCGEENSRYRIYEEMADLNKNRNFFMICDDCFIEKWEIFLENDQLVEPVLYGNPEIIYDLIFVEKGFKLPKRNKNSQ